MKLFKMTRKFNKAEDGAVTVDWVVLTAALVGLAIAVVMSVKTGTTGMADAIGDNLSDIAGTMPAYNLGAGGGSTGTPVTP